MLKSKINKLKAEKDAIILSHTYQLPEIQEIADFIGDSLELAIKINNISQKNIIFCGVRFMSETAKIIAGNKKNIIMPNIDAGCPMADMITAKTLKEYKKDNPETKIVCYVNSTAEVKAESDVCCTSSNALKIVRSLQDKKVMFVPDTNLGTYVKNQLNKENMDVWPGHCTVHSRVIPEDILELKEKYPVAKVLAHPECKASVLKYADYILSTAGMINTVKDEKYCNEFIIITEKGISFMLNQVRPDAKFYFLDKMICVNMKKTKIEDVLNALETLEHKIELPEDLLILAKKPVDNMLSF